MIRKPFLTTFALLSLGGISIALPAAAASGVLDQSTTSYVNQGSDGMYCPAGPDVKEGNSFTAGISGPLVRITALLDTIFGTPGDVVINVWQTSGGLPTGSALATETIPAASIPGVGGGNIDVTFTTPATVTAGQTYAYTLEFASCAGGLQQLEYHVGDVTVDKQQVIWDGTSWKVNALRGSQFGTYVDGEKLAETGSTSGYWFAIALALIALGGSAIRFARR